MGELPRPSPARGKRYDNELPDSLAIYKRTLSSGLCAPLSREKEEEIVAQYKQGDKVAEARLSNAYQFLVAKIAHGYMNNGVAFMDLIQEGNLGLLRAAEMFDPGRGTRFITYAHWWIRAFIRVYIQKEVNPIKGITTEAMRKVFNKLSKETDIFARKNHRDPTPQELADILQVNVEDVLRMMALRKPVLSLDAPVRAGEGTGYTLADRIACERTKTPEQQLLDDGSVTGERELLEELMNELTMRERVLIKKRYLEQEDGKCSLKKLGKEMGISRERVRQLINRAIEKMQIKADKMGQNPRNLFTS